MPFTRSSVSFDHADAEIPAGERVCADIHRAPRRTEERSVCAKPGIAIDAAARNRMAFFLKNIFSVLYRRPATQ